MGEISLTLHNRTKLDVVFWYNDVKYPVTAGKMQVIKAEAGHYIYFFPPKGARAIRKRFEVESDQITFELEKNATIECKLIAWKLDLTVRPSVV